MNESDRERLEEIRYDLATCESWAGPSQLTFLDRIRFLLNLITNLEDQNESLSRQKDIAAGLGGICFDEAFQLKQENQTLRELVREAGETLEPIARRLVPAFTTTTTTVDSVGRIIDWLERAKPFLNEEGKS